MDGFKWDSYWFLLKTRVNRTIRKTWSVHDHEILFIYFISTMENERSKSASQKYTGLTERVQVHEPNPKPSSNKYKFNSRLLLKQEMTSTPAKKSLSQDAAPQAKNISNSSTFLGAVSTRYYPGRKSILKSFKDCSLSPCSEEYTFVMQGFKEVGEEPVKSNFVARPRRLKNRKTSLNEFARGTKHSSTTPRLENDKVVQFRQRPRGNTLPERVSEIRIPCEKELDGKTKENTQTRELDGVAFGPKVKLAWQEMNEDPFSISAKKESRRPHVSLCYPKQRQEGHESKNSEASPQPGGGNVSSSKEILRVRRKAEIELPKIKERGFIDDLQKERNNSKISDRTQGKISVAHQMKSSIKDLAQGENWLARYSQRQRSYSCEHFTGSRDTTKLKPSLAYSLSLPETDHFNVSEKTLAPLNLRNKDCELKVLSDKATISRRTSQFSILRRVGQATLVATRLLKMHYRENGMKNDVNITQEEKELEELFEEMKDCRYLRQSSYEMRT